MNIPIDYTADEIASICNGSWKSRNVSFSRLTYLSLDTRKISYPGETIFFAIKNRLRDANDFINGAYEKGVRNFVTDDANVDSQRFRDANIILVEDTLNALQALAIFHRSHVSNKKLTVIGITGSNGKTIVKEWLNQLLEEKYSIVRSPKSFNSQIGVPLSVLSIENSNDLAIFEAGISEPGEMKKLEKIIQPQIGILTNIGNAHDEGFKNNQQKIREKLLLFSHAKQLIFCADDERILKEIEWLQKRNVQLNLFSWGRGNNNALQIKEIKKANSVCRV